MKHFLKYNSLSIVFFSFFLISFVAQTLTGRQEYNGDREEHGAPPVTVTQYLNTGHFFEATFENWESEFLQMWLFIWLSACLYQKGSSESKDPDKDDPVDRKPDKRRKGAPWPVRKGGLALQLYQNSLSIVFFLLFLFSFLGHWYGSLRLYNEEQLLKHSATETAFQYLGNPQLWFESFENWQSEFLSVLSIVLLSIFLRQKGSAQSKPVDAAHEETGD